jgi:hypothetical protein
MNNWMKMGFAGIAIASCLPASAKDTVPYIPEPHHKVQSPAITLDETDFKIEASDLIAAKLRDYVVGGQTENIG